jgi:hypothetical protein
MKLVAIAQTTAKNQIAKLCLPAVLQGDDVIPFVHIRLDTEPQQQ